MDNATTFCPIIRLNVGGVKYQTTVQTLTSVPGSMLEKMFASSNELSPAHIDEEGYFFIDRNGPAFAHALEFLRSGMLPSWSLPLEEAGVLRQEAAYYGLEELEGWAAERVRDRRITVQRLKGWLNIAFNSAHPHVGTVNLANMDGSDLDLAGFDFPCSIYARMTSFEKANLSNVTFDIRKGYSFFENTIFDGAVLEHATMVGNFAGATFAGTNLGGALFARGSYFDNLTGADLRGVTFHNCFFSSSISLKGAILEGTNFIKCVFVDIKDEEAATSAKKWNFREKKLNINIPPTDQQFSFRISHERPLNLGSTNITVDCTFVTPDAMAQMRSLSTLDGGL